MDENSLATIDRPIQSPSGTYELVPFIRSENPRQLDFRILNRGEGEFESIDGFLDSSVTFFMWDEDDRAWVYSGDTGTFFWTKEEEGWIRSTYATSDVPAPPLLKELRPRWHPK